jgi:BirA family transcriptional regulator, biotin operon repressor / biotin---[acetyl-CoA-carboxylase] ligase
LLIINWHIKLNFNLQLYQQTWQQLNQSQIIIQQVDIATPIPVHIFDSIPSTNTKIWELIDRGIEMPESAIARQQTAGKGQWGRNWVSSTGGLYFSLGLNLDLAIEYYPHLVIATVWGIATVLRHYQLPVTIKWFNDLILNQRKLGGIKIETRNLQNKIVKAVIGVGINWCNPVPEPGINLKSYYQKHLPKNIQSLEELTAIASYGIVLGYNYYLLAGIEQLLTNYLAILSSLRQQVKINDCPGEVIGVTTEGKLKIRLRSEAMPLGLSPGATTKIFLNPGQISLGYVITNY